MSHIDDVVLNAYLDEECGDRRKQEVEEHLARCDDCQARLEKADAARSRASQLIGTLEPGPIHAPAWQDIASRGAAPGTTLEAGQPSHGRSRREPRPFWRRPALAWAATVVIAFGLGWLASSPWITPAGELGQVTLQGGEDRSRSAADVPAQTPASGESADTYEDLERRSVVTDNRAGRAGADEGMVAAAPAPVETPERSTRLEQQRDPEATPETPESRFFTETDPDDAVAAEANRERGAERLKNEELDRLVAAVELGEAPADEEEEPALRDRAEAPPGPPAELVADADLAAHAKKEEQADEPQPEILEPTEKAVAAEPARLRQDPEQQDAQAAGAAGRQDVGEREAARARRVQAADEMQVAGQPSVAGQVAVAEQPEAAETAQTAEQMQVAGALANYHNLLERNAGLRSNQPMNAAPGWVPVQPHEAEDWLGAPLRRLPELTLVRVEVGPGVAIEDGFVGRAVVSLLYEDAAGQQITLIQQYGGSESGLEGFEAGGGKTAATRRQPAAKPPGAATEAAAGTKARNELKREYSQIVTPSGVRAYRWRDADGYLLIVAGQLSSDALRALADRVR